MKLLNDVHLPLNNVRLFLALLVNEDLSQLLEKINPELLNLYIQKLENFSTKENVSTKENFSTKENVSIKATEPMVLIELSINNQRYLGKFIEEVIDLPQLKQLETHIHSVLNRLIETLQDEYSQDEYSIDKTCLRLIPVPF